jgi:O-antigen/teichoic acid export membrane protein
MLDVRRGAAWLLSAAREILLHKRPTTRAPSGNSELRQRSIARYRGIVLGGGFAGLSRFVSLLSVAISVPLTVRYLEPERYGMWMTISSLLGLLAFADLGIGNGLVSTIASLEGKRDKAAIRRSVSSAVFILSAIGFAILILFTAAYNYVPWSRMFAVSGVLASREAGPSVMAFVVCFVIGLPFSIVQRVQMGLQESWRSYLWQCAGSLISLMGILGVVRLRLGVPWLVIVTSGGPVIASIFNSFVEFARRRPEFRPEWASVDFSSSIALVRSGAIFVALQLSVVAGTASDSIIISQVDGAAGVSSYAVMYKLFQTALIFSLFVTPLWPAMGESLSRGDYAWARSAMSRAITLSLLAGAVLSTLLFLFAQPLVRVWAGPTVVPSLVLVGGFCVWVILAAYGGALTSLLNNSQFLRLQLKMYAAASIVALLLKVPMARWLGPAGVVWATVGAYFFLYCIPAGIIVRRTLHDKPANL